jgi:hypothetical protein
VEKGGETVKITTDHQVQQNLAVQQEKSVPQGGSPAFANVLEKAIDKPSLEKTQAPGSIQPLLRPAIEVPVHRVYAQTDRMMQAMERYHRLLSDTQANLRAVEPAMQKMKKELSSLEDLMNEMPAEHPMKQIVSEALMIAGDEIARFEGGAYVADDSGKV